MTCDDNKQCSKSKVQREKTPGAEQTQISKNLGVG